MARPIWELGVEAPAVSPIRTGPSGSQPLLYLFPAVQRCARRFVADGVALYAVAARYVVACLGPSRQR